MKLSVVILNFNVSNFLRLCLQSVEAALTNIESEIIVVDNNSEDDSCQMVAQNFPQVILIENNSNLGFSKGNNIGVAKAKGEYVCILNPDTVVAEDTFEVLLKFAISKGEFGVIGCQLIDGRGHFLPESKRHIPTPRVSLKKLLGNPDLYYLNELKPEESGESEISVGAFMLMKREVYLSVGGFDEDYFMYGEDIDLSYKLLKKGLTNYYVGNTVVIHFKGESTLKDSKYAKRFYGAMQIFYKKHFKTNVFFALIVNSGIKLAYALRPNRAMPMISYDQVYYLSNKSVNRLKENYDVPAISSTSNDTIKNKSLLILDADDMSFKSIIQLMKSQSDKRTIYYRIQPKNSNFIIGSDSNLVQGEIVQLASKD